MTNTNETDEPSPASAGSQPVAYEIHWKGQDGKYLAKPYLVFANEQPLKCWNPSPRCVPLYRQPQPTLTDEEREAIEEAMRQVVESDCIATPHALEVIDTLRGLLERTQEQP
ncbi:MAG: hypothetical protein EBS90_11005 [Betaproteobacteria bacterium]|nr:hypothetical protein [Betaproteobacteria bacterium]